MKNLMIIASVSSLAGCVTGQLPSVSSPGKSFDKFVDRYYEEYLKLNPLEATQIGNPSYNDRLPNDVTEGYRDQLRDFYQRYQDSLKTFHRSALDRGFILLSSEN